MQLEEKVSVLEAILFASGDPVEEERLAQAGNIEPDSVGKLIALLNDRYQSTQSALKVIKLDNSYQLTTKQQFAGFIKTALENKRSATLTPAGMEVLTIVAYNQPVTKSFVEHVRGIDSSSVVNSLVEKDLLEEAGRLDIPGRPVAFRTTDTFLRCFQLSSINDLPPLPSHSEQVSFDEVSDINDEEEIVEEKEKEENAMTV